MSVNSLFTCPCKCRAEDRLQEIHPSSIPLNLRGGAGANPSCDWVRGGVHPGQVASITTYRDKPSTLTVTPMVNVDFPVNLTPICMSLDCGRKLEKTHTGFRLGSEASVQTTLWTTWMIFSHWTSLAEELQHLRPVGLLWLYKHVWRKCLWANCNLMFSPCTVVSGSRNRTLRSPFRLWFSSASDP